MSTIDILTLFLHYPTVAVIEEGLHIWITLGADMGYSRKQSLLLMLLFITVVINYMDRTNIAVAAPALSGEMGLSPEQMGLIFSAFGFTYSGLQIPGGMLADVARPRVLYPTLLTGWSLATIAQAFASSFSVLVGCRALIGVFEAPSYPINNKIVTSWFAPEQRASAISIYTSGQFIGLAFLTPVLFFIQDSLGWRGLFIVTGAIGVVWALFWFLAYRDRPQDRPAPQTQVASPKPSFSFADQKLAFTSRKLWGLYIGQFCLGSVTIFFLTWFPTYLAQYRGIPLVKTGMLASIPFLAAFFGVLASGFVSDALVRRGVSASLARKGPVLVGMALSMSVFGAIFADSTSAIIAILALAFFGNGLASIAWVFVSLIAPDDRVGIVGGVFNFAGGLSAVITPIAIGALIDGEDFTPALLYIGAAALCGALSYVFLVGKVEKLTVETDPMLNATPDLRGAPQA